MRLCRLLPLFVLAWMTCALAAASAQAGVLVQTVGPCEGRPTSQVFLPWLDPLNYTQVSGGTFEDGAPGWTLSGAAVVAGNETSYVTGAGDSRSLSLPPGGSATTPSTCVGLDKAVLRLFARNTGSLLSTLRVDVRFEDASGAARALPLGVLVGTASWRPTLPIPVIANLLPLLPEGGTPVAFSFTALGNGGNWRIDDVHLDPRRGH